MSKLIGRELRMVVLFLCVGLVISWWLASWLPLVLQLLAILTFHLVQLIRLYDWVQEYPHNWEPPESLGAWGELTNSLYRLLRKENTARDELSLMIQRTEKSLSAMRDGVVLLDRRQKLETWNLAAAQALSLRMATDRRQPFTNFVRHPQMIDYLNNGDFSQPLNLAAPHNSARMLEYSVTRFGAGEYLLLIRDVTRLHRLEQMRQDFVANVSHELKTPLTVFKGYLETLLDLTPAEETVLVKALRQMSEQSQRMELLIHDLLWLARLEGSEIQQPHQRVNLYQLCATVSADSAPMAAARKQHINLNVDNQVYLEGDPDELRSALTNLMTNAINYTQEGGRVDLVWQATAKGGCLQVLDNGPGIARQHLPRLAERFYRPDASRITATGGTGLGLSIVKHILLRHDASLEIASTLGQGSCFGCCFPAHKILPAPEEV